MKPKSLMVLAAGLENVVYGGVMSAICQRTQLIAPPLRSQDLRLMGDALGDVEVLFTSWEAPRLDVATLGMLPKLRAVFNAAGTVRYFVTDQVWKQKIRIYSAHNANALPVAHYCQSMTILALKGLVRQDRSGPSARGIFEPRIGLISFGLVARKFRTLAGALGAEVLVFDPYVSREDAAASGVRLASLDELFSTCDVVSVHAPLLATTRGLIRGEHLCAMVDGGVLINTARGAIIDQDALIDVLQRRPDLTAILDVTEPDTLPPESPLPRMPNVVLTHHQAGSVGRECRRLGLEILSAYDCWIAGMETPAEVLEERLERMA